MREGEEGESLLLLLEGDIASYDRLAEGWFDAVGQCRTVRAVPNRKSGIGCLLALVGGCLPREEMGFGILGYLGPQQGQRSPALGTALHCTVGLFGETRLQKAVGGAIAREHWGLQFQMFLAIDCELSRTI